MFLIIYFFLIIFLKLLLLLKYMLIIIFFTNINSIYDFIFAITLTQIKSYVDFFKNF